MPKLGIQFLAEVAMRYWWIGSSLVIMLAMGRAARAEQTVPPDDFRPCSTNNVGQQYPQVNSRRQVRFRIYAPKAQSISVFDTKLVKGADGFFTGTTSPLNPGYLCYQITIDGVAVLDPNSETFFDAGSIHNGIEIPEPGVDFYDNKDVPHGEIRSHWYKAESNGQNRQAYVYTPPDYDKDQATRYPVLYLLHGAWQDRRAWAQQGRANFILDNLIAQGKAVPMIVVMEDGGIAAIKRLAPSATRPGAGPPKLKMPFTSQIITDVIPMVDSTFRTIPDRDHRAIAGLSLGGMQTYQITQANLDKFAYIGVFSAPFGFPGVKTGYNGLLQKPEEFDKQVKVFFISMGSKEDTRTGRAPVEQLKAAGIKHVIYYEAPGTAHEFQTWRKSLHEFAPLLFQS
jgi:enterochelin esterase family protein